MLWNVLRGGILFRYINGVVVCNVFYTTNILPLISSGNRLNCQNQKYCKTVECEAIKMPYYNYKHRDVRISPSML